MVKMSIKDNLKTEGRFCLRVPNLVKLAIYPTSLKIVPANFEKSLKLVLVKAPFPKSAKICTRT
jgi:hypothetical protein